LPDWVSVTSLTPLAVSKASSARRAGSEERSRTRCTVSTGTTKQQRNAKLFRSDRDVRLRRKHDAESGRRTHPIRQCFFFTPKNPTTQTAPNGSDPSSLETTSTPASPSSSSPAGHRQKPPCPVNPRHTSGSSRHQ
jgi:hypothetical protein